jgi:hypothetical protein
MINALIMVETVLKSSLRYGESDKIIYCKNKFCFLIA